MTVKKIAWGAVFLAFGILIPFATAHAFGIPGTLLLPMHISVFIGAMILGPRLGLILGILTPVISMFITGMPSSIMVFIMTPELAFYGLSAGYLYHTKKYNIYLSLIVSMIIGRIAYALSLFLAQEIFLLPDFLKIASVLTAVTTGFIGIILHILLIPILVKTLERYFNHE